MTMLSRKKGSKSSRESIHVGLKSMKENHGLSLVMLLDYQEEFIELEILLVIRCQLYLKLMTELLIKNSIWSSK